MFRSNWTCICLLSTSMVISSCIMYVLFIAHIQVFQLHIFPDFFSSKLQKSISVVTGIMYCYRATSLAMILYRKNSFWAMMKQEVGLTQLHHYYTNWRNTCPCRLNGLRIKSRKSLKSLTEHHISPMNVIFSGHQYQQKSQFFPSPLHNHHNLKQRCKYDSEQTSVWEVLTA